MQAKNEVQRIKQFFSGKLCHGMSAEGIDFDAAPICLDVLPHDSKSLKMTYEVIGKRPETGTPLCSWPTVAEWIEAGSGSEAARIFRARNPEYTRTSLPIPRGCKHA
jgi:hypothetical protein